MKDGLIDKLYEPFELREREGLGGMKFKYIPSVDIIDRMNKVFDGCWSTEITSQERMDDFVVVRISVSVLDKDSEKIFVHDGYGSSPIARYTSGKKEGQIINLGNAYKAAAADAVKNACKKWGVGLYLEEAPEEAGDPFAAPTGGGPGPSPNVTQPMPDTTPPPFPSTEKDTRPGPPDPIPEPKPDVKMAVPDIPPVGDVPPDTGVPTVAIPDKVESTGPTDITQGTDHDKITDVQKVAIQGLLQIKAASFGDIPEKDRFLKLVTDALGRTDDLPGNVEDLSYHEAVTVIKYGNDIDKK